MELLRWDRSDTRFRWSASDGVCFDLRPLTDDIDPGFFASDGIERVRAALDSGELAPNSREPSPRCASAHR
jgi:2,4-diketo-3-deoxy-L-fuconate hydrolase